MNVLLVEDSDEVRFITVEYLQELGHEVVAVAAAEQALALLSQSIFDVVMTDIRLPGISGTQLARELHKSHPALPVVICSGYDASKSEVMVGQQPGRIFILPKPYDFPELERVLNQAAASRQSCG